MARNASLAALLLILSGATAGAWTITRETATTADGITLVMKRYKNTSGKPVILCHGIVQNYACMDLAVTGSSMARYLADRGYDVWVANLRSHGDGGTYQSGHNGRWDWSIDEFAAYDVPAMVSKVSSATGKKPFWVGHSMGGMAAYGYLQGVTVRSVKIDEVWGWQWCGWYYCYVKLYDVYAPRIVRDASLSTSRNAALRGLVTVGSPVKMKWLYDVSILDFWLYDYWDYNLVVDELAHSSSANAAIAALKPIPFGKITTYLSGDIRSLPYIGGPLADFLQWVFGNVGTSLLTAQVWNPANMNPAISQAVMNTTIDDTEPRVCLQFLDGAREKTWRDSYPDDPMRSPYVYASNYAHVKAPLLMIAGDRDKMCNDNVAYWEGFKNMGSSDKSWRDFANFGHDDLVLGVQADDQVYPFVANWLQAR